MRIYQVNCAGNGSTGAIATAIHNELLARGEQPMFAYGVGNCRVEPSIQISSIFETRIHDQLSKLSGKQGYYSPLRTIQLIRSLKHFQPDLIQLHNIHGNYLNLPLLFAYLKESRVKVVITLHDCWLFTGKCPHFTDVGCYRWKDSCGNCPQLSIYPKSYGIDQTEVCLQDKKQWIGWIQDRLTVVAVSEWLQKTAEQSFIGSGGICCIHNGIDVDMFKKKDLNMSLLRSLDGKFVILGVASRWSEQKGLIDFFKLARRLSDDEIIFLVGLNQEQIRSLPERIIGIPRTENQSQLAEIYSRADVLFNASTEETFGLVVAEAMACGTPVIVYDSTACGEIVTQDTGVIVPPKDICAVSSAIHWMKKNQYKKKVSDKCSRLVQREYNNQKMAREYYDLYISILSKNS